jgi:hypothetical protein
MTRPTLHQAASVGRLFWANVIEFIAGAGSALITIAHRSPGTRGFSFGCGPVALVVGPATIVVKSGVNHMLMQVERAEMVFAVAATTVTLLIGVTTIFWFV